MVEAFKDVGAEAGKGLHSCCNKDAGLEASLNDEIEATGEGQDDSCATHPFIIFAPVKTAAVVSNIDGTAELIVVTSP